ncbi:MAG TPA: hypothetical protein VG867_05745 [Rhizomicrobium sp.]|nr:hypothetical protein [Rhizomicrobium sp.]HWB99011.1 hypothetical protein [Bryobacteraceae bacterium]
MEQSAAHMPDAFSHIRLILGFVVSLSLARLLTGLARFVQHPGKLHPDVLHLLWTAAIMILLVHFWWWEFWLGVIPQWNFGLYAFLLLFVLQFFLLTTLLYPDNIAEYKGYGEYFMDRRAWFFGLFASVQVFDMIDTLIKGENHASQYDWTYWAQDGGTFLLAIAAIFVANRIYQIGFAVFFLVLQIWFIASSFATLG